MVNKALFSLTSPFDLKRTKCSKVVWKIGKIGDEKKRGFDFCVFELW